MPADEAQGVDTHLVGRFGTFIRQYCREDAMAALRDGREHIDVDASDIFQFDPDVYEALMDDGLVGLAAAKEAMREADLPPDREFEHPQMRITGAGRRLHVHEVRGRHLHQYVSLICQVQEVTKVKPECQVGVWNCRICGWPHEVARAGDVLPKPTKCTSCERKVSFDLNDAESVWQDKQSVKAGSLPEETSGGTNEGILVHLYDDLCGQIQAGDRLRIYGVPRIDTGPATTESNPDADRRFYFEANGIEKEQVAFDDLDTDRADELESLATSPDLFDRLVASFVPHIHWSGRAGYLKKLGPVLQLFGATDIELPHGTTKRGTINILLIGDPETGKTDCLEFSDELAPKSVFASGKNATAAGLSATATRSEFTGGWSLEAGALVLANGGLACIDEFDKMKDDAQTSMHEALESQRIPINKAGHNTVLPAKTAVLAAANPESGTYDRFAPINEQIDIDEALFSRFDLVFVFEDTPDADRDATVATGQHAAALPDIPESYHGDLDPEFFREYIAYARQEYDPVYRDEGVIQKAVDYFVDNVRGGGSMNPPGYRTNDTIRRLAQASARARLSDTIEEEDVDRAIELVEHHLTFIATDEHGDYDKNKARGKASTAEWEVRERIKEVIRELEPDHEDGVPMEEIEMALKAHAIPGRKTKRIVEKMKTHHGELYCPVSDDRYRVA